jgi:hypothetical protein
MSFTGLVMHSWPRQTSKGLPLANFLADRIAAPGVIWTSTVMMAGALGLKDPIFILAHDVASDFGATGLFGALS